MKFKALPVTSLEDATVDLEQLSTLDILNLTAESVVQLAVTGTTRKDAFGSSSIVWPGASNLSSVTTVTHGLGASPLTVLLTPLGGFGQSINAWVISTSTTQFTYQVFTTPTQPGAGTGTFGFVFWRAIG